VGDGVGERVAVARALRAVEVHVEEAGASDQARVLAAAKPRAELEGDGRADEVERDARGARKATREPPPRSGELHDLRTQRPAILAERAQRSPVHFTPEGRRLELCRSSAPLADAP
jgi:hypothetical protein